MAEAICWEIADGAQHNFSPASVKHSRGLYVSAAPCNDTPGWGLNDADIGLRMMSLTSWLDLICKCKIQHVMCLMGEEEMQKKFSGLLKIAPFATFDSNA